MNTEPAATAGASSGATTVRNAVHGRAPRSAAASRKLPRMASIPAYTGSTM